jgi:CHASE3 domain sensor protein
MLDWLSQISFEKKIAVGLVAVIILLLGRGYVSYRSTNDLLAREGRVAQTHQVRETIERLLYQMEDIEDRQRLDLFTGENQFLQSFREANRSITEVMHSLATLTSDDQPQQEQLRALRRLIDLRMTQLKDTIELRNAGRLGPDEQRVHQHAGKETMDQMLMVLSRMREQEQTQLITWSKQADEEASFRYALTIGGTFGTVVLALTGGWMIFYDLSKQSISLPHTSWRLVFRTRSISIHAACLLFYSLAF